MPIDLDYSLPYLHPDTRNVMDEFKGMDDVEIRRRIQAKNFSVAVYNPTRSVNIGAILRSAHILGAREFIFFGEKKWDPRASVGAKNYQRIVYLKEYELDCWISDNHRSPILCEYVNGQSKSIKDITSYPDNPVFIFGNESMGFSERILAADWPKIHIPQSGALRSFNVSVAAGIIMWDWTTKHVVV